MAKTIRNDEQRAALVARLKLLTGEEQPQWGTMTADQMMSHLVQAGDLPLVGGQEDRSNIFSRIVAKRLLMYVIPMPKRVKVSVGFDQQAGGRKPVEFAADRDLVIGQIETLATAPADLDCKNHPFFGKTNIIEWCIIAHKHIDHHLRQFGA